MSSSQPGTDTSQITVTDISLMEYGSSSLMRNYSCLLSNFRGSRRQLEAILNVVEEHPGSFNWPDLDVDLGIDSTRHPEKYPLRASVDL